MNFEYIIQWALMNDFELKFLRDRNTKSLMAYFTFHDRFGRVKTVTVAEGNFYNDFFRRMEYEFPQIVEKLKHVKMGEIESENT